MQVDHECEIGGVKYYTSYYKSFKAQLLLKKVFTLAKGSVEDLVEGQTGNGVVEQDGFFVVNAVLNILEQLSDQEYVKFILDILSNTRYQSETGPQKIDEAAFDQLFQGEGLLNSFELIKNVVMFQFQAPLKGLGVGLNMAATPRKQKQKTAIKAK